MKNKFIRIVSPFSAAILGGLNCTVAYFGYLAAAELIKKPSGYVYIFAVLEIFAIIVAVFVNIEILSQGIRFEETKMIFTAIDEDGEYRYSKIESVETFRDTKASFVKNFIDRQSQITLNMTDGRTATVTIGITTKRQLKAIENEINRRIRRD